MAIRVLILTSLEQGPASRCLPQLVASDRIEVAGVVLAEGAVARERRWINLRRKLAKTRRIGLAGALNGLRMRHWYRSGDTEQIDIVCARHGVPLHRTPALNCDRTVELVTAARADLGLSLGNAFIAERVFSIPRLGMINVHGERLPQYQNAQSVIWPIFNNETTTGLTIHQIDRRIDTGPILYSEEYPILLHDTLEETVRATSRLTADRTPAAIRHVCENFEALRRDARPQGKGASYTTPSIGEFLRIVRNHKRLLAAARARTTAQ